MFRLIHPLGGMGLGSRAGGGSASPYFQDIFTDTDTTALASHTPAPYNTPAASWTTHAGTIAIASNQAAASVGAFGCSSVDLALASLSLSLDFTTRNAGEAGPSGMAVRTVDQNNTWVIGLYKDANLFRIVERNASTNTTRASTSFTVAANTTYALAATMNANSITATVNGGNSLNYASATFQNTATRHGLFWNETSAPAPAKFDNFYRTDA